MRAQLPTSTEACAQDSLQVNRIIPPSEAARRHQRHKAGSRTIAIPARETFGETHRGVDSAYLRLGKAARVPHRLRARCFRKEYGQSVANRGTRHRRETPECPHVSDQRGTVMCWEESHESRATACSAGKLVGTHSSH